MGDGKFVTHPCLDLLGFPGTNEAGPAQRSQRCVPAVLLAGVADEIAHESGRVILAVNTCALPDPQRPTVLHKAGFSFHIRL
jgi:hypothetical protein